MGPPAVKLATLLLVFACGLASLGAVSECQARSVRGGEFDEYRGLDRVLKWSPDGTQIAIGMETRISVSNTDGSILLSIPEEPSAYSFFERDAAPDISPDGMRVVYSTWRYSTGPLWDKVHSYEIATSRLDGTDAKRLTKDTYADFNPVWSPDGTRIAFMSYRKRDRRFHIYAMAADGSDIRYLSSVDQGVTSVSRPTWSPNGRSIAFVDKTIKKLSQNNYPASYPWMGAQPHPRLSRRSGNQSPLSQ